jgi:hypothetical protein
MTVVYFSFHCSAISENALLLEGSQLSPVSHSGIDEGKYAALVE